MIMFNSMTSHFVSVTFKMANKVLVEVIGKNFEYLTDIYCSNFLDLTAPIVAIPI